MYYVNSRRTSRQEMCKAPRWTRHMELFPNCYKLSQIVIDTLSKVLLVALLWGFYKVDIMSASKTRTTDEHECKHTAFSPLSQAGILRPSRPIVPGRASILGVLLQHSPKAFSFFSKESLAANQTLILGSVTGSSANRQCMEAGCGLLFNPTPSPRPQVSDRSDPWAFVSDLRVVSSDSFGPAHQSTCCLFK